MAGIDCDLTTDICKVRVKIGDAIQPYLYTDGTIQAFLDQNNDNIMDAAIELLIYCLTVASGRGKETVGDVEVDWPSIYRQKSELLDKLQNNPSFGAPVALHQFGGVSVSQKNKVYGSPDNVKPAIKSGEFTDTPEQGICGNPQSIYRTGCI